jgi:hypothetical protein
MSAPQEIYRVYCFDRASVTAEFIKAISDEEAIANVKADGFGTKCEIWHGRRLVAEHQADPGTHGRLPHRGTTGVTAALSIQQQE